MKVNKRKLEEIILSGNLHRLSDETIHRVYKYANDEIQDSIEAELSKVDADES